jgi:hypothetical protein
LLEDLVMTAQRSKSVLDYYEAAVDEIIASCSGDMRGAVKALMLVNEQLESELQQLCAATASGSPREQRVKISLH